MSNPKLVFDDINCRVVTEDDSINAFYTDNQCPHEVVEVVVKMYNKGKKLIEIDAYLLDADCTQDAREIMIEGLNNLPNYLVG